MKCAICGIQKYSVEEAIEEGWIPYDWDGEHLKDGPFCPFCSKTLIQIDEVGEYAVKEEFKGKIAYQEGDFVEEEPPDPVSIGIILKDGGN
jgi:endogenous inhibitor of DNA gyrase (YacG/DUF329 family)